jgi:hypothetical protein
MEDHAFRRHCSPLTYAPLSVPVSTTQHGIGGSSPTARN